MIIQKQKMTVVTDKTIANVCQIICSRAAVLVLALGIRRLSEVNLDEMQLSPSWTGTLCLTGIFLILAFRCCVWRRAT